MTALYNEVDPVACAALRELIASGVIADAAEVLGALLDAEEEAMTGNGSW